MKLRILVRDFAIATYHFVTLASDMLPMGCSLLQSTVETAHHLECYQNQSQFLPFLDIRQDLD